jgi:hypothetical protein
MWLDQEARVMLTASSHALRRRRRRQEEAEEEAEGRMNEQSGYGGPCNPDVDAICTTAFQYESFLLHRVQVHPS